jgi:hypothetical protein
MQDGASAPLQYSKIRSFGSVAEMKGVCYSNSHRRDSLTIVPLRHILLSNIISSILRRATRYSQYAIDFDIQMLIQKVESLDARTRLKHGQKVYRFGFEMLDNSFREQNKVSNQKLYRGNSEFYETKCLSSPRC